MFSFVSEIYSKIAQNSIVQATPAVVHFAGFDLGKPQRQILQLGNVSTDVQRMHIIPPQTKYFDIKYKKGVCLLIALYCPSTSLFVPIYRFLLRYPVYFFFWLHLTVIISIIYGLFPGSACSWDDIGLSH